MADRVEIGGECRAIVAAVAESVGVEIAIENVAEVVIRHDEVELLVFSTNGEGRKYVGPLGGAACERFRRPARTA